ncbi:hypothetical protein BRC72_01350 [Halobacteriales archaeon QH_7_66_36]|nr:MAG: hypothetical protein BRC72_01350 [Halobacteriales archaeon QH_7_66_36]
MSDDDANPRYVCEGCQTVETGDGETKRVDKVREVNSISTARMLADIHAIKTGHSPEVRG